jgi:hypothetical protein
MTTPVQRIVLNNLQYNPNRDPQFYRRMPNDQFRLQAFMTGSGSAKVRFEVEGNTIAESELSLPAQFECEMSFDSPGSRVGMLTIEYDGQSEEHPIRLDVMEHAWVG